MTLELLQMQFLENYFKKVPEGKRSSAAIAYCAALDHLLEKSPRVAHAIVQELKDQRRSLKLIASENFSSLATQLAMGNLLTDKYAEGFPHHRFYAGCENVDLLEEMAAEELKTIFGCDHAYVQPHSGADANLIALWAFLVQRVQNKQIEWLGKKTVDELSEEEYENIRQLMVNQKLMGMSMDSGGHLTHGYRHNLSSKIIQSVPYKVDRNTGLLDYAQLLAQTKAEKPDLLLVGYSAYPRRIDFAKMREIADSVGAILWVDMAHFAGLVAGKVFQGNFDPIPFAHLITSTTHKTMRGPRGGFVLCQKEFKDVVNKGCPLVIGGPLPHVIAAKAISFQEVNTPDFQKYAHQIVANSHALASVLMEKGCELWTHGTDNHLLVIDVVRSFGLNGRQAEIALRRVGLTSNRNAIPFDVNGAWYTSGIRIGTPAVTTLGMREGEMREIGLMIYDLLRASHPLPEEGKAKSSKVKTDEVVFNRVQRELSALLERFPLYPELMI